MKNSRILIVGPDKTLAWQIYNDFGKKEQCLVYNERDGEKAHQRIKRLSPDLVVVDLETPGLVRSWIEMELENSMKTNQLPVIMMSDMMAQEEREIVTDLTGHPVVPKTIPLNQLNACIKSYLLQ